jgi:hypothetical protein
MSSGSQPQPPSPTQSAQAEAASQLAGYMFNTQNNPIMGYQDAITRAMIQPYTSALQSALDARTAAHTAAANRAIQYQTDPQAYQAREMALQGANNTVGRLYGVDPSVYSFQAPNIYSLPATSGMPSLDTIAALSRQAAGKYGSVNVGGTTSGKASGAPANVSPKAAK